jgi:hypothetical protein
MSMNKPPFTPPPHPTYVHIHREPPPGSPSPYVAFPADPNAIRRQWEDLEQNYWTLDQRPGYFILTALIILCVSTYVVFKALTAMYTFDPANPGTSILFGLTVGLFVGGFINVGIFIIVTLVMNGLSFLLTGKSLFPTSAPGGHRATADMDRAWVAFGGVFGLILAEAAWIITGLAR